MTPERQKWWDSLPKEEKRVRRAIKELRTQIAWHKIGLNSSCGHETEMRKFALRMNKRIIKALRKEIAQYPYRKDTHRVHCPNCWVWIVECYNEPPYCKYCGQKLRWRK